MPKPTKGSMWDEVQAPGESMQDFMVRVASTYKVSYPEAMGVVRLRSTVKALDNAHTVADLKPILQFILEELKK